MNCKEKLIAFCEGLGIENVEILIETLSIEDFKDLGKAHLNYKTGSYLESRKNSGID